MSKRTLVLMILDGWGLRAAAEHNAPLQAQTPHFDRFWANCPRATLTASGEAVGLPEGQIGNSEVGHLNLGAGRVVMQTLPRVDAAFAQGEVTQIPAFQDFVRRVKAGGGRAHLLGLVSPGGVHAQQRHLSALANLLHQAGLEVLIHAVTDGRDSAPNIALSCLESLQQDAPAAKIVSIIGRYYAMDRDQRWERTALAYHLIAKGEAEAGAYDDPLAALAGQNKSDEFIQPLVAQGYQGIAAGDGLLCTNFRADRARQILSALARDLSKEGTETSNSGDLDAKTLDYDIPFPALASGRLAALAGLVSYSDALSARLGVLFEPQLLRDTLGEVVSAHGSQQLRLAETEKYPHVTFFFNGGREAAFSGETRELIPSPKVATYDLQPEMSAPAVGEALRRAIRSQRYDLIIVNYANPDMVGHTGSLPAAIKACEAVDKELGRTAEALDEVGGLALVTADHGNCETMWDAQGQLPHTAHTTNPVPIFLLGAPDGVEGLRSGRLADVAPTLLDLMGIVAPPAMDGQSLLVHE